MLPFAGFAETPSGAGAAYVAVGAEGAAGDAGAVLPVGAPQLGQFEASSGTCEPHDVQNLAILNIPFSKYYYGLILYEVSLNVNKKPDFLENFVVKIIIGRVFRYF
jgi:hypothetical protein